MYVVGNVLQLHTELLVPHTERASLRPKLTTQTKSGHGLEQDVSLLADIGYIA